MITSIVCEAFDSGKSLLELYRQWHELTGAEGQAIRAAAWNRVEQFQETKYRLQPRILEALETLQSEVSLSGADSEQVERELRSVVSTLISGEKLNVDLLGEQRASLEGSLSELNRSTRNLRQVHRAYSGPPAAAWHSYS